MAALPEGEGCTQEGPGTPDEFSGSQRAFNGMGPVPEAREILASTPTARTCGGLAPVPLHGAHVFRLSTRAPQMTE